MQSFWVLMAAIAGALVPVQTLVNNEMRRWVLQPLYSTFVNFAVGTVLLAGVLLAVPAANEGGRWKGAAEAPWWAWTGGAFGLFFVTVTVLAVQRIGNATLAVSMISGQMIGALILDHYGLMGSAVRTITPERLLAAVFLAAAVWLMQK